MITGNKSKHLVLIGGGHANIEVIRQSKHLAREKLTITLISAFPESIYSGLLPGVIAGHFPVSHCQINLIQMCKRYDVSWLQGEIRALYPSSKTILLVSGQRIHYDLAAIDTGSVPWTPPIIGSGQHILLPKPWQGFLKQWSRITEGAAQQNPPGSITVVGGGVAGVELVLAMQHRIRTITGQLNCHFRLVTRDLLLPNLPKAAQRRVRQTLKDKHIQLFEHIDIDHLTDTELVLANGKAIRSQWVVLCTAAIPGPWLENSNLPVSEKGFIRINKNLNVEGELDLFAVGDIAELSSDLAKAGVYPVRQAPVLFENLQRILSDDTGTKSLARFKPQRKFLKLITLGQRKAVAVYGVFSIVGRWVWYWKRYIDRRFVHRYQG